MFNGAAISWKSKRQNVVALSSAEAEFMAASALVQEVCIFVTFSNALDFHKLVILPFLKTIVLVWSEGAVGGSDWAKHIEISENALSLVHDAVKEGVLSLHLVRSEDNFADLLAKTAFLILRKHLMES